MATTPRRRLMMRGATPCAPTCRHTKTSSLLNSRSGFAFLRSGPTRSAQTTSTLRASGSPRPPGRSGSRPSRSGRPAMARPTVFAEWPSDDPDAPTVVVYGHHDVQPVDPIDSWSFAPFEPAVVPGPDGDRLLGRGAADDKGMVLYHLLGLAGEPCGERAHQPTGESEAAHRGRGGVRVRPRSPRLLREKRDRLGCDVVVVSDNGMYAAGVVTTCVRMRGLTDCQIDLHGPDVDLHSGSFGGVGAEPPHGDDAPAGRACTTSPTGSRSTASTTTLHR